MRARQVNVLKIKIKFHIISDYKKGFGGEFGIQSDRKDKTALGWEDNEKVKPHESQTGNLNL